MTLWWLATNLRLFCVSLSCTNKPMRFSWLIEALTLAKKDFRGSECHTYKCWLLDVCQRQFAGNRIQQKKETRQVHLWTVRSLHIPREAEGKVVTRRREWPGTEATRGGDRWAALVTAQTVSYLVRGFTKLTMAIVFSSSHHQFFVQREYNLMWCKVPKVSSKLRLRLIEKLRLQSSQCLDMLTSIKRFY